VSTPESFEILIGSHVKEICCSFYILENVKVIPNGALIAQLLTNYKKGKGE
jgi:hypothetical protein